MRRVIDRLGMHAASLRAVSGRALAVSGTETASTEPVPPPVSGGAPEPEADVFIPSEADERWLARNPRPPIRSAGDLLAAVGQFLAALGLEPDIQADAVDFLFLGRLHRVECEDVEGRLERCQVSGDEAAMLAAGLPAGRAARPILHPVAMPPGVPGLPGGLTPLFCGLFPDRPADCIGNEA
jgi:hypothetical protein